MDPFLTLVYADASNPLIIWTTIETNVLLMASPLPAIVPFIRFIRERHLRATSRLKGIKDPYQGATGTSDRWRPKQFDPFHSLFSTHMQTLPSDQHDFHLVDFEKCNGTADKGSEGLRLATHKATCVE